MRITIFLTLTCVVNLYATSYSQEKLTLSLKGVKLTQVFSIIQQQTNYQFLYNDEDIQNAPPVSVVISDATVPQILAVCFTKKYPLKYWIEDSTVVVLRKSSVPYSVKISPKIEIPSFTVTGNVTDFLGNPLVGVSVSLKGTSSGAVTDGNGNYSLTLKNGEGMLVFSYVGYEKKEVEINGKATINVALSSATTGLNQLVVVGYGTQKKSSLTGAISTVKGSEITKAHVPNISNSIAGRVSGVSMRANGGQPGQDNPDIYIRGIGTTGSSAPLIVVDGIPRDNISQINPEDIESVTVLKDAAAVSPYGLGGANGVLLITTKRGEIGSPTISINSYFGVQTPTYTLRLLNAKDYMKLTNEAYINEHPGTTNNFPFSPNVINNYDSLNRSDPDLFPDGDIMSLVKRNAPIQNHGLQIKGGSEKTKYFASMGYFSQNGIFDKVSYERFNYTLNLETEVTNTTKVSFSFIGSVEQTKNIDPSISTDRLFRGLYKYLPTDPIFYSNGLPGLSAGNSIPAILNSDSYEKNDGNTLLSTITIEQKLPFVKGLSLKGTFSYDSKSNFIKGWHTPWTYWIIDRSTTPYTFMPSTTGLEGGTAYTYLEENQLYQHFYTSQGYLDYKGHFGNHEVSGLLVAESRITRGNNFNARRNHFTVNIDELNMGSSKKSDFDNGGTSMTGTQIGLVYRFNYGFKDKYLFEATGRYDGHYYFAPGKRWGYFPAFSAGWRLSEENFMKNLNFIENLKVRASWGKSGNLAGSPYQYLSGYDLVGGVYAFGAGTMVQGAYTLQEPNPNITWEIANKADIGFDATLWKGLLTIEGDYFFGKRTGMLLEPAVVVPDEYGLNLSEENAGIMKNNGFEFSLELHHSLENGMKLGLNGNFSFARNKVIQIFETEATFNNPNRRRTGRPLGTLFGYHALGLFTLKDDKNGDGEIDSNDGYSVTQFGTLHPGDIKYKDVSGPDGVPDGVIDDNDKVVIGYYPGNPQITYGFIPSISWKGFDLNLFLQGATLTSMSIATFQTVAFENNKSNSSYEYFDNHWTPNNENSKYPRATTSPSANNTATSDFWMKDNSYLRLKTATLGYTIENVFQKSIRSIRFYFTGQNLLTLSKIKFMDPATPNGNSIESVYYPVMSSLSFGVNITF